MEKDIRLSDADAAEWLKTLKGVCGGNPLMTPEAAALMLAAIGRGLEDLRQQMENSPRLVQEWGTCSELGKIYGKDRTTMYRHLRALAADGKVRTCTTKDAVSGTFGNTMYNLKDVERCFIKFGHEAAEKEVAK